MGVTASHCIAWFQTQLILTKCQIRYYSLFFFCEIIVELDSCLEYHMVSRLRQLILVWTKKKQHSSPQEMRANIGISQQIAKLSLMSCRFFVVWHKFCRSKLLNTVLFVWNTQLQTSN